MAQNTVENISNLKLAIYCIYIFFCQMRIDRSFTWNWKLIGCSVLCGLCPSPLHGCLEPESCCTSHSADRVCASLYPGNWPFQLKHKGNTGTSVSIRQPQEMLMYVLALLNTQVPAQVHIWWTLLSECQRLPKYTVLSHLGQMFGWPENELKLAAGEYLVNSYSQKYHSFKWH